MATGKQIQTKYKNISIQNVCIDSIEKTKDDYLQSNRLQMLYGFDKDGNRIGTYRNKYYKQKKQSINPKAQGFVDLRLTGRYYQSLEVQVSGTDVLVHASDSKAKDLEKKYGTAIYGIGKDYRRRYLNILSKQFINEFSNK